MTRRRAPKPLAFELTEGYLHLRVPDPDAFQAFGDDLVAILSGETKSGRFVHVEATIPRHLVQPLARALWRVVACERVKVAAKEASLRG